MKGASVIIGVLGLLTMVFSIELGAVLLCVGLLMFVVGNRKQRESVEERRHQEILDAMRKEK